MNSPIHPSSLSQTIDTLAESLFYNRPLSRTLSLQASRWLATRLALPGAYANTFALFPDEIQTGIRLFTGERATSASARHLIAEETCRTLRLLPHLHPSAKSALTQASSELANRVGPLGRKPDALHAHAWWVPYSGGVFCCGPCTIGLWRHITAGGFDQPTPRLTRGLRLLKDRARPTHDWQGLPFWYTLSSLLEMPRPLALPHLQHAAPLLQKSLTRANLTKTKTPYPARRQEIARRALTLLS